MTYHGTLIPEKDAPIYAERAYRMLFNMTAGRIEAEKDSDAVVSAVSASAEVLYRHAVRGDIHQENNDGYSVTFRDTKAEDEVQRIARSLLPPYLLFRAVEVV